MHDPFAMRPFFGYNFGDYLQHWLSLPQKQQTIGGGAQLPRIYQVNWFRKSAAGGFLWPGFGENSRVMDWILRRIEGEGDEKIADRTPIGFIPKREQFRLDGLKEPIDWDQLFSVPSEFWQKEIEAVQKFWDEQVGDDLPAPVQQELLKLRERFANWNQ